MQVTLRTIIVVLLFPSDYPEALRPLALRLYPTQPCSQLKR